MHVPSTGVTSQTRNVRLVCRNGERAASRHALRRGNSCSTSTSQIRGSRATSGSAFDGTAHAHVTRAFNFTGLSAPIVTVIGGYPSSPSSRWHDLRDVDSLVREARSARLAILCVWHCHHGTVTLGVRACVRASCGAVRCVEAHRAKSARPSVRPLTRCWACCAVRARRNMLPERQPGPDAYK